MNSLETLRFWFFIFVCVLDSLSGMGWRLYNSSSFVFFSRVVSCPVNTI